MFRTRTVLIVGAGASCEFGLPKGSALLQQIAQELNMEFTNFGQQTKGGRDILEAYRRLCSHPQDSEELNTYIHAGRRLAASAAIARSIDNAIDQNDKDDLIPVVGKIAIAQQLIQAEKHSPLINKKYAATSADIEMVKNSWVFPFGQMLTTDVRATAANKMFENVSIISFNYDRAIEYSLPTIISTAYGFKIEEAHEIAASCQIWHPYGSLGNLPRRHGEGGVPFGSVETAIEILAQGLRTFGESMDETPELVRMRAAVSGAERIVFLGFGFHPPNMQLLNPENSLAANKIYATVYEEPYSAVETIKADLSARYQQLPAELFGGGYYQLGNMTCINYLTGFYSSLTS